MFTWMNGIDWITASIVFAFGGTAWLMLTVGYREGYKEAHREHARANRYHA